MPATVPAGSTETDIVMTITTTAPTTVLARSQSFSAGWLAMTGLGLIGAILAIPSKRRKASALLMTLLFMGALTALVGCGNSSRPTVVPGTPAGTYTVTVTGTSGSATQTTNLSLTVH